MEEANRPASSVTCRVSASLDLEIEASICTTAPGTAMPVEPSMTVPVIAPFGRVWVVVCAASVATDTANVRTIGPPPESATVRNMFVAVRI